jgi:hypothetical protein
MHMFVPLNLVVYAYSHAPVCNEWFITSMVDQSVLAVDDFTSSCHGMPIKV